MLIVHTNNNTYTALLSGDRILLVNEVIRL
jgi:hypothetical protein